MDITEREAWLNLTVEDPIDPVLPICDPHHHLWDRPHDRYLLDDLLKDTGSGHNIVNTVFVECRSMYRNEGPEDLRPVGETEFVQGIADQCASGHKGSTSIAAGIVSNADLTLGDAVTPVLEAHLAVSENRFRGIRHIAAWDASDKIQNISKAQKKKVREKSRIPLYKPPPGLLLGSKFREGFACLQQYDLSFESWLFYHQIGELTDLARAFPETSIILDHIGGPLGIGPYAGKRDEVFKEWQNSIQELSTCPNVTVKLGGMGMPIFGFGWHEQDTPPSSIELAEDMAPYFNFCIDKFGVDRCMFESNFPVDKVSFSYSVMWNAFKRISKDFSPDERSSLFYNTAVKVYRLTSN